MRGVQAPRLRRAPSANGTRETWTVDAGDTAVTRMRSASDTSETSVNDTNETSVRDPGETSSVGTSERSAKDASQAVASACGACETCLQCDAFVSTTGCDVEK